LIYGAVGENPAQQKMLAERGNVAGFFGSIYLYEAFPGEEVCGGCVGLSEVYNIKVDGREEFKFGTSHPEYHSGVRSDYCPNCRAREFEGLKAKFLCEAKVLGYKLVSVDLFGPPSKNGGEKDGRAQASIQQEPVPQADR